MAAGGMIPTLADRLPAGQGDVVRAVVRADLNVPLRAGEVADATRIERFVPTARRLLDAGVAVIILSHLGRPRPGSRPAELSLRPVAAALAERLAAPVAFLPDCVGEPVRAATAAIPAGGCALLENLRFHPGEEADDPAFAAALAAHGDFYVNDAFSCSHRAHASIHALAGLLPACAGPGLLAEVEALTGVLDHPARPTAALVGGAKISGKIAVLEHLAPRMDALIIGGAMANTFLAASGHAVGRSLFEPEERETAERIAARCRQSGCQLLLPVDAVVAEALTAEAPCRTVPVTAVPDEAMILDIGPASVDHIRRRLDGVRTLLWNGPLGAFETAPFHVGTAAVARHAAALTRAGRLTSVAGGGDTVAALRMAGAAAAFSYVSTAGGAFLEWIEGRPLPGIVALATSSG